MATLQRNVLRSCMWYYRMSTCGSPRPNQAKVRVIDIRLRFRNHLFRQRLHRVEYYKEECNDVSWGFLLRP